MREALAYARANDAIVIPCGGATSVVGHLAPPTGDRPVLSLVLSRLRRLLHLDPLAQLATFEAGVAGPDLEAQLRDKGFMLGHYPQSFEYSTLGGWIATRSSGQQSSRYGRIEAMFAGALAPSRMRSPSLIPTTGGRCLPCRGRARRCSARRTSITPKISRPRTCDFASRG